MARRGGRARDGGSPSLPHSIHIEIAVADVARLPPYLGIRGLLDQTCCPESVVSQLDLMIRKCAPASSSWRSIIFERHCDLHAVTSVT